MTKTIKLGAVVLLLLAASSRSQATKLYVPYPYLTINAAIAAANPGDIISVWLHGNPDTAVYSENIICSKTVEIVARCYDTSLAGYPPANTYIHIQPQNPQFQGPIISISNLPDDTLPCVVKGFTIENGSNLSERGGTGKGGGIYCQFARVNILNDRICSNQADSGAAIYWAAGGFSYTDSISNGVIESNVASSAGGGLCATWLPYADSNLLTVRRDTIRYNVVSSASGQGAGGALFGPLELYGPSPAADTILADDYIAYNTVVGGDTLSGGGLFASSLNFCWATRNVFLNNSPTGVSLLGVFAGDFTLIQFGWPSPGFNVFLDTTVPHDFVACGFDPTWVSAAGNDWGTLSTDSVYGRILVNGNPSGCVVAWSPIAGSSKWLTSWHPRSTICKTGVIVTGDLDVPQNCSLHFEPPDTIDTVMFQPNPDTSLPGGNSSLCDLLVDGHLTTSPYPYPYGNVVFCGPSNTGLPSNQTGEWQGITVRPGGRADFAYCTITNAEIGIDAEPSCTLSVGSCAINRCQTGGIRESLAVVESIGHSDISDNGTYGIDCEGGPSGATAPLTISGNTIRNNPVYGIECNELFGEPGEISGNTIRGDSAQSSIWGISLFDVSGSPSIIGDTILHCPQAGILMGAAWDPLQYDEVVGSGPGFSTYGIYCSAASPSVRSSSVDGCSYGVFSDQLGLPDLGDRPGNGSPGYNSILMGNAVWVAAVPQLMHWPLPETMPAEFNWWGTTDPDSFPTKFCQGRAAIEDTNWLDSAPGGAGSGRGGEQNASVISPKIKPELCELAPNPFTHSASISYAVGTAGITSIRIYDLAGRKVRTLVNNCYCEPGRYNAVWNRQDDKGRLLPEGVYFLRLDSPSFKQTRKVVIAE
jgi:hypothetical protein